MMSDKQSIGGLPAAVALLSCWYTPYTIKGISKTHHLPQKSNARFLLRAMTHRSWVFQETSSGSSISKCFPLGLRFLRKPRRSHLLQTHWRVHCSAITSMGCRIRSVSPVFSTGYFSSIRSAASSSFFTRLGVCRVFSHTFSHFSLSLLLCSVFYPFLSILSQRHHSIADGLSFGQQLGPFWSQPKMTLTWGCPLAPSHRGHPLSPPTTDICPQKASTPGKL